MKLNNVFRISLLTLLVVFSSSSLAELVELVDFKKLANQRTINANSQNFSLSLDVIEPGLSLTIDNPANFSELLEPGNGLLVCRGNRGCGADPLDILGIGEFLQFTFTYQGRPVDFNGLQYEVVQTGEGGTLYIVSNDGSGNELGIDTYLEVNFDYSGVESEGEVYITSIFTRIPDGSGGDLSGGSSNPDIGAGGEGGTDQGAGNGNGEGGPQAIPEPSSYALMSLALLGVFAARRSRRHS